MRLRVPRHIARLAPYQPGKPIEEVERELGLSSTVKLASNENPLGPSPKAIEAVRRALSSSHRYPDGGGFYLKRALSGRLGVSPERIVLGNGSTELVELLARTFMGRGGEAVLSEGAFIMYRIAVQAVNGRARLVPQTADLRHDAPAMARAAGPRTRLLFVANPNNPTGTYITRRELERLLAEVTPDTLVVVDEAYREYVVREDYPDALALSSAHPNVVVLRTFSKIHGLAGLRIGFAVVHERTAAALERVRSPFNTSSAAQAAALAALEDREHVARSRESNLAEMAFLRGGLERMGLAPVPSVGNFLLLPVPSGAMELYRALMARGVIVRPMGAFGFPQALRITVGTRPENERCLRGLESCLDGPPVRP